MIFSFLVVGSSFLKVGASVFFCIPLYCSHKQAAFKHNAKQIFCLMLFKD